MILPPPRWIIPGATARAQRNIEVRLVASTVSHSSSVTSSVCLSSVMPALLTRTSIGPSAAGPAPGRTAVARLRSDPLRHELAEAVLLDLAARGHRKLPDDLDPLRKLVLGELLAIEERGDLRQRDGVPVARDHHRARA